MRLLPHSRFGANFSDRHIILHGGFAYGMVPPSHVVVLGESPQWCHEWSARDHWVICNWSTSGLFDTQQCHCSFATPAKIPVGKPRVVSVWNHARRIQPLLDSFCEVCLGRSQPSTGCYSAACFGCSNFSRTKRSCFQCVLAGPMLRTSYWGGQNRARAKASDKRNRGSSDRIYFQEQ